MIEWYSDPALRSRCRAGLNKGEAGNKLTRAVFFHERGEIRDGSFESQAFRASALNLVVSAIILWNTVYLSRVVDHLRAKRNDLPEDLLRHASPQIWGHILSRRPWPGKRVSVSAKRRMLRPTPVIGLCLGMQTMVTAVAQKALGSHDANLAEVDPSAPLKTLTPLCEDVSLPAHRLGEKTQGRGRLDAARGSRRRGTHPLQSPLPPLSRARAGPGQSRPGDLCAR
jgi:hypothetical protein